MTHSEEMIDYKYPYSRIISLSFSLIKNLLYTPLFLNLIQTIFILNTYTFINQSVMA